MKNTRAFLGVVMVVMAALIAGPIGVSQAQTNNNFTVELYRPFNQTCVPSPTVLRVDIVENGTTTIHHTLNGVTTFTVNTPTDNEILTIKYYKSTGALAGSYDVMINYHCGSSQPPCSDPWDFGKGVNSDACFQWAHGRLVHISYIP